MAAKVFLVVVIVGVVLIVVGTWMAQPRELTPEEAVAKLIHPESKPVVSREAMGRIAYWAGAGLIVAGGVGLLFCGVRKSFLTGGACHE